MRPLRHGARTKQTAPPADTLPPRRAERGPFKRNACETVSSSVPPNLVWHGALAGLGEASDPRGSRGRDWPPLHLLLLRRLHHPPRLIARRPDRPHMRFIEQVVGGTLHSCSFLPFATMAGVPEEPMLYLHT